MESSTALQSKESIAEVLRLTLAKLGQLNLPVTAINYAVLYTYFSGEDVELKSHMDELLSSNKVLSDDVINQIFQKYICRCKENGNGQVSQELSGIVAQIIGMVVDLSGRTAISSDKLESHMTLLAESKDPSTVLTVASNIIAETRSFVDDTKKIELSLKETTQEIEHLKGELDNARKQATVDALTGLNNRRGFDRALKKAIVDVDKGGSRGFSLIMLDIDHFKNINDTHGHLVGDKVLVGIARQLTRQMRGNDYLSRFGGEEFAIILLETPITSAFTVAENLRKSIEALRLKHTKTGQQIGKVTISLGLAGYNPNESAEDLIQRCDKALYRAKSLNRNRTVLAD